MKLYFTSIIFLAATIVNAQDKKLKELSTEAAVAKGATIRIINAGRNINIKTWAQPKVKLTVNLLDDEMDKTRTEEEWWDYLNISIKTFSNRVEINSRGGAYSGGCNTCPPGAGSRLTPTGQSYAYAYDSYSSGDKTKQVRKRVMDIFIPEGSKLDIDSKGSDIVVGNNMDDAIFDIQNTSVDAQDVKKLRLTSRYSSVNFLNIGEAEVEFENGNFKANNLGELDIDSKSSSVEYENGKYAYIRSQNDNYTIESIDKIEGRKLYGEMRIETLNSKIDIEGNNADIKIRNFGSEVEQVKINNKYADIRLPVKNLKNYAVNFYGLYSTVFTPFEKVPVKKDDDEKGEKGDKGDKDAPAPAIAGTVVSGHNYLRGTSFGGEVSPARFTGSVGDTKGKHTKFELVCHSCTVDFK
jgi:hypothetical protein